MANGARRRRKPAQNGVEAVFTPDGGSHGYIRYVVGLVVIGTGAALWVWGIQPLTGSTANLIQLDGLSSSLILMSLAMSLVIGGVGWSTYFLAVRRTRRENNKIRSAIYELEALVGSKNGVQGPPLVARLDAKGVEGQASPSRIPKSLAVALVEAVMLTIVYSGLVQEYASNINMQEWVHSHVAFGGYLLSYNAVLLLTTALSGVLVYQLLPRNRSIKETRQK